jgi:hypothetical protein
MRSALHWSLWIAGGLVALGWALSWPSMITDERIDGDDLQSLTMAVNLRYHGVASLDQEPPYAPSMYREPLPVLTTAFAVWLADVALGEAGPEAYLSGDRARLLKLQNLFWLALLCLSAFWATYLLTSSRLLGVLAVLLMNFDVIPLVEVGLAPLLLDSLMPEVPASALSLATGAFLIAAMRRRSVALFAWAGVCFGLLALTKATFLYVFIGFAAVLLVVAVIAARKAPLTARFAPIAAVTFAFAAVVVPWMARNYVQLGEFQLAERGGIVLYLRALKNGMTSDEYRGAFWFWGPKPLQPIVGRVLGFSSVDLKRGGRLQRINRVPEAEFYREDLAAWHNAKPGEAITFIRKALAEEERLKRVAAESGESTQRVDAVLQQRAVAMIADDPVRHLKMIPLLLWRGALFPLPVLLVALVYALRRRDYGLGVFVLPGLGTILFFALLTEFIPRYSAPILPTAVVALVALAWYAVAPVWRTHAHRFAPKWLGTTTGPPTPP